MLKTHKIIVSGGMHMQKIGIKIKNKMICPQCGSRNTTCIGGSHYVNTGEGLGHNDRKIGYQCNECKCVFIG